MSFGQYLPRRDGLSPHVILITIVQRRTVSSMGALVVPGQPAAEDLQHGIAVSRSSASQADTHRVLTAYCCVLDLVHDHGAEAPRSPGRLGHLKPAMGLESYVIEHVRTNADRFSRRFRMRLALAQNDSNDAEDRAALDDFMASLPPQRSRLWVLLPYLAALALTQVVISIIGHPASIAVMHNLVGLVSLNPQQIGTSADSLIRHDDHLKVFGVMLVGSAALWLSFRPLMWGFRVKRMLLNEPRALRRRKSKSKLTEDALRLNVRAREEELCSRLGMPAPFDSRLDLWVKATILVTPLTVGIAAVIAGIASRQDRRADAIIAAVFVVPVALRLAWLGRCARERGRYHDPTLGVSAQNTAHELMRQQAHSTPDSGRPAPPGLLNSDNLGH